MFRAFRAWAWRFRILGITRNYRAGGSLTQVTLRVECRVLGFRAREYGFEFRASSLGFRVHANTHSNE